jgi:DNA replication protein DnaC
MFFTPEQREKEMKRWENRLIEPCLLCKGEGSITTERGTAKMCECTRQAHINTELASCGLPSKYLQWTWDMCEEKDFVKECKEYANNFVENYLIGKGLYLEGSQGRGKSTMEVLIAKEAAAMINPDTKQHFKVAFSIYEDMVQLSHKGRQGDRAASYKLEKLIDEPDLLIIDNIGSETGFGNDTKYTTKLLEYILRKRDNAEKSTIISSNFNSGELEEKYSDTIYQFVDLNCDIIMVTGENNRRKKNGNKFAAEADALQDF